MPSFKLQNPPSSKTSEVLLHKNITSIGSAPDNDIIIPSADDYHAVVHCDKSAFQIQVTSRNSELIINGKKKKKEVLRHLDEIKIADATLSFSLLSGASASTPNTDLKITEKTEQISGYRLLHEFSQKMLTEYELPSLINSLMDAVIAITQAEKGFLILSENDEFKVKVARNMHEEDVSSAVAQVSDAVVARVVKERKPLIVNDALNDADFNSSQSIINLNLCSVLCVPLLDRGSLIGLIYVGNTSITKIFTDQHLELITVFAAQASLIIANAIMINELKLDNIELSRKLTEKRFGSIIGACDAIKDVFRTVERVAPTSVNVLIVGETGTGKELIAHEIHARSPRAKGPFITLNCGAIPENLLESELFGHVKGAFTGATHNREGSFKAAHTGTIFLDEIGEMPINLQVKLLRVLQEHTITPVGATHPEKIDIRVVAATNKDLELAIRNNEFREDLFYRLNVVMLQLPPLRHRGDDVVVIAQFLIKKICDEFNLPLKQLGADAVIALKKYDWPGNIRQLENRLKKAIVLADRSVLKPEDLDLLPEVLRDIVPLADAKEQFAHRYILEVLERNNGNRAQTARELEVDPRTIFRYLEKTT